MQANIEISPIDCAHHVTKSLLMMQKRVNWISKTNYGDYRGSCFFLVLFFISSSIFYRIRVCFLINKCLFFEFRWIFTENMSFLTFWIENFHVKLFALILKNTWNFRPKSVCLKSVLFPVLTLPTVKAFYVLIFFSKGLCVFFGAEKAFCAKRKNREGHQTII